MAPKARPWYELLWAGINVGEDGECWTRCGASLLAKPHIRVDGVQRRTSTLVLELKLGRPLRPGYQACHHCDHPGCHNPTHLWEGTQKENLADMTAKGRGWTGDRNGARKHPERLRRGNNHPLRLNPERAARGNRHGFRIHPEAVARGEQSGMSKLNDVAVRTIRQLIKEGRGIVEVARAYRMNRNVIAGVASMKSWRHVP